MVNNLYILKNEEDEVASNNLHKNGEDGNRKFKQKNKSFKTISKKI